MSRVLPQHPWFLTEDSLCDTLKNHLIDEIKKAEPGSHFPGMRHWSRLSQLPISSVDEVLKDLCRRGLLSFKPNKGYSIHKPIETKTIVVVFGGADAFGVSSSPFYKMFLDIVSREIGARGYKFKYYVDLPDLYPGGSPNAAHQEFVSELASGHIQGVIVPSVRGSDQVCWFRQLKVPTVIFLPEGSDSSTNCVTIDWASMLKQGVDALVGQGCDRIGWIHPMPVQGTFFENHRLQSFKDALSQHSKQFQSEWVWDKTFSLYDRLSLGHEERGYWTIKRFYEAAAFAQGSDRMKELAKFPDGLVICDDYMARGALLAFHQMGLDAGIDVKIVTHSNKASPALTGVQHPFMRLEIDPCEVVTTMIHLVENLMNGQIIKGQASAAIPSTLIPR
ncbi:MAG: LacI family DNA-binding transcriptional regulator [Verrucomicrobiota bacterium]|nr:LacI family DNA-binding transcriptional regulator [Verrucomicrobiota bacterium]